MVHTLNRNKKNSREKGSQRKPHKGLTPFRNFVRRKKLGNWKEAGWEVSMHKILIEYFMWRDIRVKTYYLCSLFLDNKTWHTVKLLLINGYCSRMN